MSISQLLKDNMGRFDFDPKITHFFSEGMYAKQIFVPKDHLVVQHSHEYSHLSILAKGKVIVKTDDYEKYYEAPACLEIKAEINHAIIAIEDCIWFCIHATNETDISKIDETLIKEV